MELLFRLLSCIMCLVGTFSVAHGGPPESDISILCGGGGPVTVFTADLLKTSGLWLGAGQTCSFKVFSSFHGDAFRDKLRMEVLSLDLACGDGRVELFDGDEHDDNKLGEICGYIGSQQTMFLSSEKDYITVNIHTYENHPFSIKLLATATSEQYESTDFICDNLWDVDASLKCDSYNNCGDWSDESLCTDFDSWQLKMFLIIGSAWVIFIAALVAVIVFLVRKFRRRRLAYGNGEVTPITRDQVHVQRAADYGSIQPNTFLPAPPPYSPQTSAAHLPPPPYSSTYAPNKPATKESSACNSVLGTATETSTSTSATSIAPTASAASSTSSESR